MAKKLDWKKSDPSDRGASANTKDGRRFVTARGDHSTTLATFKGGQPKGQSYFKKVSETTHRTEKDARREARRQSKY